MRRFVGLWLVMLVMNLGTQAQRLDEWLNATGAKASEKDAAHREVSRLMTSFGDNQPTDQRHLWKVFRKIHSTVLKQYEAYVDFASLFTTGNYDCLTATMLFSHLLTELGYDFEVVETNYHIFILVKAADGRVLLETTDRVGGFITDEKIIAQRIESYRKNEMLSSTSHDAYRYRCRLYQTVSPEKLLGLLYFNQAVKAYNRGDWLKCSESLEQAHTQYASDRCRELGDILIQTLLERKEVTPEVRTACLGHLKSVVIHRAGSVASN
ncbi:MAG: hypothetical protein JNL40_15015 [Cyclobacteriaceae bacterium]|nr:hypothetical protein [Cyclobacteriaceae bacterium]